MIDKLHYISQATTNRSHLDAIAQVLEAGGRWIQLRIKEQPMETVLELAIAAHALCTRFEAKLIVNDYPFVAKEIACAGVHLGLQDMPVAEARQVIGPDMIIGGTANTFDHILDRVAAGANYIGLGPYRFTRTKQNLSPLIGLEGYREIMTKVKEAGILVPVIAIGGIRASDIPALMAAGVYGVAVSGALTNQPDTSHQIKLIYDQLNLKTASC
jgi:thiamine-phosphate pyrophosphorylase